MWKGCVLMMLAVFGLASGLGLSPGTSVDVFVTGEGGYDGCYKIPAVMQTVKGTLLAFAEARKFSCSDYTWTDIVVKRSTDGGLSWSNLTVVASNSTSRDSFQVVGNAAPVQDRVSHRIHIPYTLNNTFQLATFSDDDGLTWSTPTHHPESTRPGWGWIGTGPPGSIQLPSGRLLVPSYHGLYHGDDGTITHTHFLYSDNQGETWEIGCVWEDEEDPLLSNESQAAWLDVGGPNGTIVLNARTFFRHRTTGMSTDGGITCTPMKEVESQPQPFDGCEGSLVAATDKKTLYFTNPAEETLLGYRFNLTLKVSTDMGRTFSPVIVVDPNPSGYSSLVVLSNSTLGLLYERAVKYQPVMLPLQLTYTVLSI